MFLHFRRHAGPAVEPSDTARTNLLFFYNHGINTFYFCDYLLVLLIFLRPEHTHSQHFMCLHSGLLACTIIVYPRYIIQIQNY